MKPVYNEYGIIPEDSPFLDDIAQINQAISDLIEKATAEGYDTSHLLAEIGSIANYHVCLHRMKQGIVLRRQEREAKVNKK